MVRHHNPPVWLPNILALNTGVKDTTGPSLLDTPMVMILYRFEIVDCIGEGMEDGVKHR